MVKNKLYIQITYTLIMMMEKIVSEEEVQKFLANLKHLKDRVEYILAKFPFTRNSDELLYLMLLKVFYPDVLKKLGVASLHGYFPEDLASQLPKFETVSRVRRKLNEQGLYLPTDLEVLERRKRKEALFRRAVVKLD